MIYSFSNSGFRDPETGVYNQTYFMEVFHREWYRHLREQQSLALLYLSPLLPGMINQPHLLDFFTGRVQASLLRATDLLARLNQQLFAVGLFNTDEAGTRTVLERINLQLREFSAEYKQHHGIGLDYRIAACLCLPNTDIKPELLFIEAESRCMKNDRTNNDVLHITGN
ncbi:deoxycytidylate deaminase [Shewanella fodinae]|jgi:GGDEF domain-containing protein|uniref:Diguanylate cyclase n=1 Tax=Shewanella fodinae TaxID=552357 RepID=A0A4R2FIT3_9GAMM|nr:deoxycytidylate deaminase [Shewanella fodinae]MCL2905067.1 deoxycytidylate deaminase [Shewanella fodinae]TCN90199.1 diguanylate cyclase [Shewanella fodinae]GGY88852.1 diguanylate cyclase [Shewanella fodinae]